MKKTSVKILSYTVFLLSIAACNKQLEVKNPNDVPVENFWKTEADATAGVLGVYDAYQTNEMAGVRYTEMDHVSDNANTTNNNFGWLDIETSTHISSNGRILARWRALYTIINRANNAIAQIGNMPADVLTDAKRKRLMGEARFLRDYAYFDLSILWGDVPLYIDPVGPFDQGKGRSSRADVRNFIINELKNDVVPNLPVSVTAAERGRLVSDAAKALLGKVYLYNQDYANAATVLKQVIDSGRWGLYPNYAELFTLAGEFSKENLWEIVFETGGIDNGENFSVQVDTSLATFRPRTHWKPIDNYANSFLCVDGKPIVTSATYGAASPYYILANNSTGRFNNRDPRLKAELFTAADVLPSGKNLWSFITNNATTAFTAANNFAIKKYFMLTSTQYNGGPQNYYMIRYADVLLMYAEAVNELTGPDQTVYDAVNAIRRRLTVSEYLSGGKGAITGTTTATPNAQGMSFDLTSGIVLKRVNVNLPQNAAGAVTVSLLNSAGVTINSATTNVASAGTATTLRVVTLPIFFTINAGTGYRLVLTSTLPVGREATATYPLNLFGAGNITDTYPTGGTGYNYFYHWQYDILNSTARMPDYPAGLNQANMRQYIRDERRWEFGFEHSRYYDLLRWRIADVIMNNAGSSKKFTNPRDYLWPYPQEEMDNNPAMRAGGQNPGWN